MTVTNKPLEKGFFVRIEAHPEYGVGRVVTVGPFSTHVLFAHGGVRVYRSEDTARLKVITSPTPADTELLVEKEAALARGVVDAPLTKPEPAPKPKKAKKSAAS